LHLLNSTNNNEGNANENRILEQVDEAPATCANRLAGGGASGVNAAGGGGGPDGVGVGGVGGVGAAGGLGSGSADAAKRTTYIVGVVVGLAAVLVLCGAIFCWHRRHHGHHDADDAAHDPLNPAPSSSNGRHAIVSDAQVRFFLFLAFLGFAFDWIDLFIATSSL